MPRFLLDLLFAFRRTRQARGRHWTRHGRVGAVAALGAALVLFCPGVALAAPGDLDPTFGTGGTVTTDFGGSADEASGVALQADGKIVAAGSRVVGGTIVFALARYNTDGSLDSTFGTGGTVTTNFGGTDEQANGVALQTDGKIVAVGSSNAGGSYNFALARYNTDGSLDSTFGTGGTVTTNFGGTDEQANGVALQTDGKIVAAGNSFVGGSFNFALARYQGGGIPQPSLTITKSHSGNFTHGGTYSITVGNSGPGATDGTITVKDTLPAGLTASSISGSGWTCTLATLTCTRSDLLAAGAAYPPITLKAKASCHTQRQDSATVTKGGDRKVTNTATVTGGGDTTTHTAADTTAIHGDKHCGNDHDHGNDRNHRNP